MGLEHQIEGAGLGERAPLLRLRAIAIVKLVLAEAPLAHRAIDERVTEIGEVSTRFEHLWWPENRCVDQDGVIALLDHRTHPCVLHVAQHQRPERAVVVGGSETTVDLRARIDEATTLAQIDDLVEVSRGH